MCADTWADAFAAGTHTALWTHGPHVYTCAQVLERQNAAEAEEKLQGQLEAVRAHVDGFWAALHDELDIERSTAVGEIFSLRAQLEAISERRGETSVTLAHHTEVAYQAEVLRQHTVAACLYLHLTSLTRFGPSQAMQCGL